MSNPDATRNGHFCTRLAQSLIPAVTVARNGPHESSEIQHVPLEVTVGLGHQQVGTELSITSQMGGGTCGE